MTDLETTSPMQRVSVITPVFNSQDFIEETYSSLARQSNSEWEWIVVDDCSTDGTGPLLEEMAARDRRITVISNPENRGAAYSRNRALQSSAGEYVAFLDADDRWHSEKLAKQLRFMQVMDADASFTAYTVIGESGQSTGKTIDVTPRGVVNYTDALHKRATIGCSTVIISRGAIGSALMPSIRTGQDYAFWLLLMRSGIVFHHLPESLSDYRKRPGSISRNKFKKAVRQWQIYRQIEGLSLSTSTVCFASYAIRALMR